MSDNTQDMRQAIVNLMLVYSNSLRHMNEDMERMGRKAAVTPENSHVLKHAEDVLNNRHHDCKVRKCVKL